MGEDWDSLFPGVASLTLETYGSGMTFGIRIAKSDGMPIRLVKEEQAIAEGATIVAIRRVNELGYYNLGLNNLRRHLGVSAPKALALIRFLGVQDNEDYYREIRIQSTTHKMYSQKALQHLREELEEFDVDAVWAYSKNRGPRPKHRST